MSDYFLLQRDSLRECESCSILDGLCGVQVVDRRVNVTRVLGGCPCFDEAEAVQGLWHSVTANGITTKNSMLLRTSIFLRDFSFVLVYWIGESSGPDEPQGECSCHVIIQACSLNGP